MRAVIGLIGVAIGAFLLFVVMRFSIDHTHMVAAPKRHAHPASKLNAIKAADSATFVVVDVAGEFHGLRVVNVVKGGIADKHFGLLPGDVVIEIGPFTMGDTTLVDYSTAKDWVTEAYERTNVTLVVERNGEELTLPIGGDFSDMVVASGGADGSGDPSDKSPQITNPGGDE